MNFQFSDEQNQLVDVFRKFFSQESGTDRVRAAEPLGFDRDLLKQLGDMGALSIRLPGSGFTLLDAGLVMEEAGSMLASVPLAEAMIATRLLAELGGNAAGELAAAAAEGASVVTLALHEVAPGKTQIVPGGAGAEAVVALQGEDVILVRRTPSGQPPKNLAAMPIAELTLAGDAGEISREVIASGPAARAAFLGGVEEWKVLTAFALSGLARQAIHLAADYAKERTAFGKAIGAYQAVAHPLADRIADVEGGRLLNLRAVDLIARGEPTAAATISMTYWWHAESAGKAVATSLHTFGGYGLAVEYDIQLYHRRAYAMGLLLGDPAQERALASDRMWCGSEAPLPPTEASSIDFEYPPEALEIGEETRELIRKAMTPEYAARTHWSYDGIIPEVEQQIGAAGLMYPDWPKEYGGRGVDIFSATASKGAWGDGGYDPHGQRTTEMVGAVVLAICSEELKRQVLPEIASGRAHCSLGYSEPHCGSDIFAARTRAVWQGDHWLINGQKMWTSGGNISRYVLLLARTDPDAPKHGGLTLFLVPTDLPGFEAHRIDTFQDEPTTTTFYADVKLPDFYRLSEVDGALKAMAAALKMEHRGGATNRFSQMAMEAAVEWARQPGPDGTERFAGFDVRQRLGRRLTHHTISELLFLYATWIGSLDDIPRSAIGPISKVFSSETYQRDMADLLQLTAPDSLLRGDSGLGIIEQFHRQSAVGTIYGGTSEIHRSQIAEVQLGLPRSR